MEDGEIDEEGVMVVEEEDAPPPPPPPPSRKIDSKSPYEQLQESKASVEDIVSKMLSIKRDSKSKPLLRDLVTQMLLHFITLRQVRVSQPLIFITISNQLSLSFFNFWFGFLIGEPIDIARRGSSESRDGASKGASGFHVASASQFDVREESLRESH